MKEFIQNLIEWDREVTVSLNGSDSLFMDNFAWLHTNPWFWIPLAVVAIFVIIRNIQPKKLIFALAAIVLTVVICDQLSSSLCKPLFERLRPSRDLMILDSIDTVRGYRGGLYGFFSGHAANSFGLAVLFALFIRNWVLSVGIISWATLNAYIRVYLGVHFLGDVLTGAVVGTLVAVIIYLIYKLLTERSVNYNGKSRLNRTLFTNTGFLIIDVTMLLIVLFSTYSVILIGSCVLSF